MKRKLPVTGFCYYCGEPCGVCLYCNNDHGRLYWYRQAHPEQKHKKHNYPRRAIATNAQIERNIERMMKRKKL